MNMSQGVKWERFPRETLDTLFNVVEVNDVVDSHVALPEPITLNCSDDEIRRCYALCLHFWEDGVQREGLLRLVNILLDKGSLTPDEGREYKYIRAKFKHLRFALVLYDRRHTLPKLFATMVALMGSLQDSFRNGRRAAVFGYALVLRGLLIKPLWRKMCQQVRSVELETEAGFVAFRQEEVRRLKVTLEQDSLSGPEFHELRKIASRQVSFYDDMRTLQHTEHDYAMSRYLSAINGIMGALHDVMVRDAMSGEKDYRSDYLLDEDLRARLEGFSKKYPL